MKKYLETLVDFLLLAPTLLVASWLYMKGELE